LPPIRWVPRQRSPPWSAKFPAADEPEGRDPDEDLLDELRADDELPGELREGDEPGGLDEDSGKAPGKSSD
jgi:hypothetical protein